MLIVTMKDGLTIDRSLKMLKSKVAKTKQLRELRNRQAYIKPSAERRDEIKKAIYIQKIRDEEQKNN